MHQLNWIVPLNGLQDLLHSVLALSQLHHTHSPMPHISRQALSILLHRILAMPKMHHLNTLHSSIPIRVRNGIIYLVTVCNFGTVHAQRACLHRFTEAIQTTTGETAQSFTIDLYLMATKLSLYTHDPQMNHKIKMKEYILIHELCCCCCHCRLPPPPHVSYLREAIMESVSVQSPSVLPSAEVAH